MNNNTPKGESNTIFAAEANDNPPKCESNTSIVTKSSNNMPKRESSTIFAAKANNNSPRVIQTQCKHEFKVAKLAQIKVPLLGTHSTTILADGGALHTVGSRSVLWTHLAPTVGRTNGV